MPSLSDWFSVSCDANGVTISASPPGGEAWSDRFAWIDVNRICFKAGGLFDSDEYYVFTASRPESYVIPTEAYGVPAFLDEIMRRGCFPADVALEAATLSEGDLICWPRVE
jgi:hypothetical protein